MLEASTATWKTCARSWLGYQCTALVCGRVRLHWSVGGAPPSGPGCSYLSTRSASGDIAQVGVPDPAAQLIHMAVQTDVTGYVALSWPAKQHQMKPADAVIGHLPAPGAASVAAYRITGYSASSVTLDAAVNLTNAAAEANATALTICFSRSVAQKGEAAGVDLGAVLTKQNGTVIMNFAASQQAPKGQHLLAQAHLCSVPVHLLQKPGGADDGGWRPGNGSRSHIDPKQVIAERTGYMRQHGALMFVGWVVLVPAGILAARFKWVFPTNTRITGLWFQVHRAVQMLATLFITIGFILPFTTFEAGKGDSEAGSGGQEDSLLEAHETMGVALMVLLGTHICVAVARPKPEHPKRMYWNWVHWWTGRGLWALALVNICIGISLWRRATGGSGAEWIVTLVVFIVGWTVASAVLHVKGRRMQSAGGTGAGGSSSAQDKYMLGGSELSSSAVFTIGAAEPAYGRL